VNKKNFKTSLWLITGALSFSALIYGCKKKDPLPDNIIEEPDNTTTIDEFIGKLKTIAVADNIQNPEARGTVVSDWNPITGEYCTSTKYAFSPVYSDGFLLSPTTDVIYPGAILDGNSIYDGGYREISLPRTGGIITTNGGNFKNVTTSVDEVRYDKVTQSINDLLNADVTGSSAARLQFEITEIQDERQLDVALGFTYEKGEKAKIKANFDFTKNVKKSRLLIKYQQIYYTLSFTKKNYPHEYFQPQVSAKDVYNSIKGANVAPVYVASVSYGRAAFFSVTSDIEVKKLKATLEGQLNLAKQKLAIDVAVKDSLVRNNTTSAGTIYGGNGSDAALAVTGLDGFFTYLTKGGDWSLSSQGAPISYTLRRISDNETFGVQRTTTYVVKECHDVTGKISFVSMNHYSGPYGDILKGNLSMQIKYDDASIAVGSPNTLWNAPNQINELSLEPNGAKVDLASPISLNLLFDPSKFNQAYINITGTIYNRDYWTNLGWKKDVYREAIASKDIDVKIYLKDIAIPLNSKAPWITSGDGNFKLRVDLPSAQVYQGYCAISKRDLPGGCGINCNECGREDKGYFTRTASTIELNFAMNVQNPNK
jgi:thiol-activated cytolysin